MAAWVVISDSLPDSLQLCHVTSAHEPCPGTIPQQEEDAIPPDDHQMLMPCCVKLCRDGSVVHINYKSQFKDGPATPSATKAKEPRNAAARSSRNRGGKRPAAGRSRAANAAAAAAGDNMGFVPAWSLEGAVQLQTPRGSSSRKRQGKRRSSTHKSNTRGRGAAGKETGSGRKRKQSGSAGKWFYLHGQKVCTSCG
jgi:hypothetical protein